MAKNNKATLIICLAFLFITIKCTGAQQINKTSGQKKTVNKGVPSIKFDKVVHDFGVVSPEVSVNCEFKFKNVGNAPLKFSRNPKAACGCTIVKLDKMEYASGESGVVKVKYHSDSSPGPLSKTITVYSNDPKVPTLTLTIKAKIEIAIAINHKEQELSLRKDNGGILPIVIKAKDDKPFAIKSFTSTNSIITAHIDKTKKATKHTIKPKVDITKLKKSLRGNITINVDHPKTKQLVLSYWAKGSINLSSTRITLLDPTPGKSETREIMISSNYGENIEIESIESAKGCIKVVSQEKKDNGVKLVLEVTPKERKKSIRVFYDYLTINTKCGESAKITALGYFKTKKSYVKSSAKISN